MGLILYNILFIGLIVYSVAACNSDQFRCDNGQCISRSYLCDSSADCSDRSDHINCRCFNGPSCFELPRPTCKPNEFQCKSIGCIPSNWECDGDYDCADLSDEHSDCETIHCTTQEFTCDNGFCIDSQLTCNGMDDCGDNSDEVICQVSVATDSEIINACSNGFKCKNGNCIDLQAVCNDVHDCLDGSDEGGACKSSCRTSICDHQCIATPSGPMCTCNRGYRLSGDGVTCSDSLECTKEPPVCSQLCREEVGTYSCSCYKEFILKHDNVTCKSNDHQMSILFVVKNQIRRFTPTRRTLEVIHKETTGVITGLDVNTHDNVVYFGVNDSNSLHRLDMTNSSKKQITNIGSPQKVAVDWIAKNVYFIDQRLSDVVPENYAADDEINESSIRICNFDQRHCAKIVNFNSREMILTIAVDPINKYLFYSVATSEECTVYRSALDGQFPRKLLARTDYITEIAIDYRHQHIYIGNKTTVNRIDYDNLNQRNEINIVSTVMDINGLNIFEDHLYFLTDFGYTMHKCRLYGEMRKCTSFRLSANATDMFVISQTSRQTPGRNPCINYNCSHLCIPHHNLGSCVCENGKIVDELEDCRNLF